MADDMRGKTAAPSTSEPPDTRPRPPGRGRRLLRLLVTGIILACAVVAAALVWQFYVTAPWTRDGRVRVQVASVAPQVSGQIT